MARTAYERGTAFASYNAVAVTDGSTTGDEIALPVSSGSGFAASSAFGWQVIVSGGTYSALTVQLEASLDGTNWVSIDSTTNIAGDLKGKSIVPVKFLRARVSAATVNTGTPKVTVLITA